MHVLKLPQQFSNIHMPYFYFTKPSNQGYSELGIKPYLRQLFFFPLGNPQVCCLGSRDFCPENKKFRTKLPHLRPPPPPKKVGRRHSQKKLRTLCCMILNKNQGLDTLMGEQETKRKKMKCSFEKLCISNSGHLYFGSLGPLYKKELQYGGAAKLLKTLVVTSALRGLGYRPNKLTDDLRLQTKFLGTSSCKAKMFQVGQ